MAKIRVIVAGHRDFSDYNLLSKKLTNIFTNLFYSNIVKSRSEIEIISGTCRGADILGEQYVIRHNIEVKRFPADWEMYGKRAGYIRNTEMAKYATESEYPFLVAFWDGKSKGTKNMIEIAKKYRMQTVIVKCNAEKK